MEQGVTFLYIWLLWKNNVVCHSILLCKISINSVYYVFVFVVVERSNIPQCIFLEGLPTACGMDVTGWYVILDYVCAFQGIFNHMFLPWTVFSFSRYCITNVKKVCLLLNWRKIGLCVLCVVSTYFWDTAFTERYILEKTRYDTRKHMEWKLMISFTSCAAIS